MDTGDGECMAEDGDEDAMLVMSGWSPFPLVMLPLLAGCFVPFIPCVLARILATPLQYVVSRYHNSASGGETSSQNPGNRVPRERARVTDAPTSGRDLRNSQPFITIGSINILRWSLGNVKAGFKDGTVIEIGLLGLSIRCRRQAHVPADAWKWAVLSFSAVRIYPPSSPPPGAENHPAVATAVAGSEGRSWAAAAVGSDIRPDMTRGVGGGAEKSGSNQVDSTKQGCPSTLLLTTVKAWFLRLVAVEVHDLRMELAETSESCNFNVRVGRGSGGEAAEETREKGEGEREVAQQRSSFDGSRDSSVVRGVRFMEFSELRTACLLSPSSTSLEVRPSYVGIRN